MPRPTHPYEPMNFISKPVGPRDTLTLPRVSVDKAENLIPPAMKEVIKVTNRAELGAMRGQPIVLVANSTVYPDEADMDDSSTWLQPGETMEIPKHVAVINFGYIFSRQTPDEKMALVSRYGGYQYPKCNRELYPNTASPMTIIGPPLSLPDLVLVQVDNRKREVGPTIELYRYLAPEDRFPESYKKK